jgi:deoxyribonuclease-4
MEKKFLYTQKIILSQKTTNSRSYVVKKNILLGAHVSIAGGLYKSIERAESIGCTTMQIFTKNNKSWLGKTISKDEADKFKHAVEKSKLSKIMAHTAYLINIGSSKPEVEKKSIDALKHELERAEQLDIPYLVLHPGAHLGAGEEVCIKQIAKNLDKILSKATGRTKILLETTAGQGTNVGYKFEQIKKIRQLCKYKKLIGVCLDTCHIFAAGYKFGNEHDYEDMIKQFSKTIGIKQLKAIHLNDSKTELGEKKDRHGNIFMGKIPKKAFSLIMNDKRLKNVPKVLETPAVNGKDMYEEEIRLLRKKVKS